MTADIALALWQQNPVRKPFPCAGAAVLSRLGGAAARADRLATARPPQRDLISTG